MLLLGLAGCASTSSWTDSWFGHKDVADQDENLQIPKGPLQPPKAAPVTSVEKVPLPSTSYSSSAHSSTVSVTGTTGGASTKTKVAILLPLSGKDAILGQAMLNAAQQAVFDVAAPNFELMPRDIGVTDQQVDMAVRDAIASGAQLLIGPLFASHVPIVHNVAQLNNVNMLTLSTDTSLAASGLYVMGFAPGAQVERVVGYATQHGVHRFAALVPDNPYGNLVGREFQRSVQKAGGILVEIQTYDPSQNDSDSHIRELATHRSMIDGLFLPEGGDELGEITDQLASAGFDPTHVRFLGTGLWDVPGQGRKTPFLNGGWYAAPDPALRQNFMNNYNTTFGQAPPRLVTLAYDATAMAAVLARRGAKFDEASLTNPNGFAGLDGIFRLQPSGLVERGLAILQLGAENTSVVDPGPTTFMTPSH